MGKKNSNSMKNLSEVMMHTPETELIVNAEILGFNQYGEMEGMKTYEKRKYLVKQVLSNPLQVLNHLSYEDLMIFQQLVDAGPGMSAVYASNGAVPPCVMLDLIDSHHDVEEGMTCVKLSVHLSKRCLMNLRINSAFTLKDLCLVLSISTVV